MAELRWGVIGARSRIYRERLRPAFEASEHHRVVAEASRTPAADGTNSDVGYTDLIERDDVDAVYIPLPNASHETWILAALANGKHVLCEKPLTLSATDTEEVFAAARSAKRVLMEAYMWPHHPRAHRVISLVEDGELGSLREIRSVFTYAANDLDDHRFDERGAGALFDVGIYCIAPALMFLGRDPLRTAATAVRNDVGVDTSMSGWIDWGDGIGSSFSVSFEAPPRRILEVTGTDGVLTLPGFHVPGPEEPSQIIVHTRTGSPRVIDVPGANAFVGMVDHFVSVIDEREHSVFGETESIRLARIIDSLHESTRDPA